MMHRTSGKAGTEHGNGGSRKTTIARGSGMLRPLVSLLLCLSLAAVAARDDDEAAGGLRGTRIMGETTDVKPRAPSLSVVSDGCSGSSALVDFGKEVLRAHGVEVDTLSKSGEILYPQRNPYWTPALERLIDEGEVPPSHRDEIGSGVQEYRHKYPHYDKIIVEAIREASVETGGANRTLLFKSKPPRALSHRDCAVARGFREIGVKLAFIQRSNVLDRAVCFVRDCFTRTMGHPVFAGNSTRATNGTRAHDCIDRRHSGIKVKAHMRVDRMIGWMQMVRERDWETVKALEPYLDAGQMFAAEDLYNYEFTRDERAFEQGVELWTRFLSFALPVDRSILVHMMRRHQGMLTRRPHSDVIDNIDEVIEALKRAGLDHYLRY